MPKPASGLELAAPEKGAARDCYEVARTAILLERHESSDTADLSPWRWARHAVTLHRISGQLHRIAERKCNEDLTCPDCGGEGKAGGQFKADDCRHCAGTGSTLGQRQERLRAQATDIAEAYGLRCYFQTDPRGCALYLIDPADVPDAATLARVDVSHACSPKAAEYLRTPDAWIEANYTRGHAVVRIGR